MAIRKKAGRDPSPEADGINPVKPADRDVPRLLRVLTALNVPMDYERSFRISEGHLLTNRILLSAHKADLGPTPARRVLSVCHGLGMPREHLQTIGFHLPGAENVHFGAEEHVHGCTYKVYLEFARGIELTINPDGASVPVLLYLAYKWSAAGHGPGAVTRYLWYPMTSTDAILARASGMFPGRPNDEPYQITRGVLELAATKMPTGDIQYLEVREDAAGRRSFDLNFYDAGLAVRDVHPWLVRICRDQNVPLGRFQELYDRVKSARIGHLSAGVHRDGAGFFSVYYGAELGNALPRAIRDLTTEGERR